MKKLLSILIIAVMLISVCSISVSAYTELVPSYKEFPEVENKYYDKALEHNINVEPYRYAELHHYSNDTDEEPDWALIVCISDFATLEVKCGALVGDRVIWTLAGYGWNEFRSGYAVYLPKTDTFIALTNGNMERIIELCPEFVETFEELGIGQLMGDVNDDGRIDVLDATYIQRVVAGHYYDYPTIVETRDSEGDFEKFSICDYDRDGECTVMDATAIQMKLANIDDSTVTE